MVKPTNPRYIVGGWITIRKFWSSGLRPVPSAGFSVRNVPNGLLWTIIRKRKNISTTEMIATT